MSDGVVLLHGIGRRASSMRSFERALLAAGFLTLNVGYPSRHKSIQQLVTDIDAAVSPFATALDGPVHFVCHSMGGLVARAYLERHRPTRLGRVVMLGPPNGGSEIADLLQKRLFYRLLFGRAGGELTTSGCKLRNASAAPIDFQVGVIAGNRPLLPLASSLVLPGPNDGKVTVRSTRLAGIADHIVVATSHTALIRNRIALRQTISFLQNGQFNRSVP